MTDFLKFLKNSFCIFFSLLTAIIIVFIVLAGVMSFLSWIPSNWVEPAICLIGIMFISLVIASVFDTI